MNKVPSLLCRSTNILSYHLKFAENDDTREDTEDCTCPRCDCDDCESCQVSKTHILY